MKLDIRQKLNLSDPLLYSKYTQAGTMKTPMAHGPGVQTPWKPMTTVH
jgi:hypothetical protein